MFLGWKNARSHAINLTKTPSGNGKFQIHMRCGSQLKEVYTFRNREFHESMEDTVPYLESSRLNRYCTLDLHELGKVCHKRWTRVCVFNAIKVNNHDSQLMCAAEVSARTKKQVASPCVHASLTALVLYHIWTLVCFTRPFCTPYSPFHARLTTSARNHVDRSISAYVLLQA